MNTDFIKEKDLDGITFWTLVYSNITPRFEVFRYLGRNPSLGKYYFRSVRNPKVVLVRSFYQIDYQTFKPFLYNLEKARKQNAEKELKIANL